AARGGAIARLRAAIAEVAVDGGALRGAALADALTDLAANRAAAGELPQARLAAERAMAAAEDLDSVRYARARYNLGTCLGMLGESAAAERYLVGADSIEGLLNLAACRADQGKQLTAVRAFSQAIRMIKDTFARSGLLDLIEEAFAHLERGLAAERGVRSELPATAGYQPLESTAGMPPGSETWTATMLTAARLCAGLSAFTPVTRRNALLSLIAPSAARTRAEDYAEAMRSLTDTLLAVGAARAAAVPAAENVALLRRLVADNPRLRERLAHGLDLLGDVHHRAGDFGPAVAALSESIAEYRGFEGSDLPVRLKRLAGYLAEAGRASEAFEALHEIVSLRAAAGDRSGLAAAKLSLGAYLAEYGRPEEAAEVLREAVELYADLVKGDPAEREGYALTMTMLGTLDSAPGGPAMALAMAERAAEVTAELAAESPDNVADHVNALLLVSSSLGSNGRVREAYDRAATAVALYHEHHLHDPTQLCDLLCTQAQWEAHLGRVEEATARLREALGLIADLPDTDPGVRRSRGTALALLAGALQAVMRPEEAAPLAEQAVALLEDPSRITAEPDVTLAEAYIALGLSRLMSAPELAVEPAVAARAILGHHPGNPIIDGVLGRTYFCEGVALAVLGRPEEAFARLAEADRLLPGEGPIVPVRIGTLVAMGDCQLRLGRPGDALESAERAMALPEGGVMDTPAGQAMLAQLRQVRGTALLLLGHPEQALEPLREAVAAYGALEPLPSLRDEHAATLASLSQAQYALADLAAAAATAAEGLELLGDDGRTAELAVTYGALLYARAIALDALGEPSAEITDEAIAVLRPQLPDLGFMLAQVLGVRAEIHAREDDLPTAIELSGEAVEALRAEGPDGAGFLASGLRRLGGYLRDVNLPQEAVTVLRESAVLFAEADEPDLLLERYTAERNLGFCLVELGDPAAAAPHLRTAAALLEPAAEESEDLAPELVNTLRVLGEILRELGRTREAVAAEAEAAHWG
ncbi:tetratricopeptide repeat protein, partial [Nonomuraea sediminis]|uniref:tetratricopeptide repeat protein n=1 Tax=Nonomuraea sediminis TaxID=2835864 RepID=UPI001BDD09F4